LKVKEQDLIQQLMDHSKADEQFLISSSYILDLANRAYELFESSQAEQKRRLLNFVFANFSTQGSKLQYKIKEPFNELLFA
jgi:site-specific DNA recombinase